MDRGALALASNWLFFLWYRSCTYNHGWEGVQRHRTLSLFSSKVRVTRDDQASDLTLVCSLLHVYLWRSAVRTCRVVNGTVPRYPKILLFFVQTIRLRVAERQLQIFLATETPARKHTSATTPHKHILAFAVLLSNVVMSTGYVRD